MITYCKKADPTDAKFIEPAIWLAFRKKWKRTDYGSVLIEYGGFAMEEICRIADNCQHGEFAPAIRNIAEEIVRRIKSRCLDLPPVRYEYRIDGSSGKLREIGIEDPFHQIIEHVAVYCLDELYKARIEPCQYASLAGKGPINGAKQIVKWVEEDNRSQKICEARGYRFSRKTEFYIQGDIRKCYQSISHEVVMREYRKDIEKNETLLWLIDELLKMHTKGMIIGSLLSQFTCNYLLSNSVRQVYSYSKERRGKRVRLIAHQVWYMDDFLLTGPDRRNVRMGFTRLTKFLKTQYGLDVKEAHATRWSDAPPDIMGFVVHTDGTMTVRGRTYVHARRMYLRARDKEVMSIAQARRLVSLKGNFTNTDCKQARLRLKVDETAKRAQKLISDYETGRLMQCIPKTSSIAAPPQPSP